MSRIGMAALVCLAASAPAAAEVKSAAPGGFEVESKALVAATPAETYAMLGRIGEWWNVEHSYSGDGANFNLELKAGGCFCEALPAGGTVEHMRIVFARPGVMLRLQGGLGPLQDEGVAGTLTWRLKAVEGGTEIVQTYIVGGYMRMGGERLAPLVDQVLADQLARLQRRLAH